MQPESKKFLFDIQRAADRVVRFTSGKTSNDYLSDELRRSAVERQFEIIGEAPGKLLKIDSATANHISEQRRIISFRNVLIHGTIRSVSRLYGTSWRTSCRFSSKRWTHCFGRRICRCPNTISFRIHRILIPHYISLPHAHLPRYDLSCRL